ncbi:helix-turn-helix domain-containing protein [Halomonas sp. S2151]|uniref:helix-turn-helix domain-containing protein n=1 Tax=Halomonas sp. S2151 TaxID=579478 RepID=UPI000A00FAA8
MIQNIQLPGGSWPHTTTSARQGTAGAKSPSSRPGKIYRFEHPHDKKVAAPDGFRSIQDVVESSEQNPKRKAALQRARNRISRQIDQEIGPTVRTSRLAKGWSQVTMADALGTSQSHVARIERGSENVTLETMRKLCNVLEVDMNTMDEMLRRQSDALESSKK